MIATLIALALAAETEAAAPPPKPKIEVVWTRVPSWRDVVDAYPDRAWSRRASGNAVLNCQVTAKGRLTDCLPKSENPSGYGFGSAALSLASKFEVAPAHEGDIIGGGRIDVPIEFRMPPTS